MEAGTKELLSGAGRHDWRRSIHGTSDGDAGEGNEGEEEGC
jgi:hypothetical protein